MKWPGVAVLLFLSSATVAAAQPPPIEPRGDAAAEFAAGLRAFDSHEFVTALRAFERSYAARPVAAVLYNIAATQLALGGLGEADASFRRFLAEDQTMTAERRAEVNQLLSDLGHRVS